MSRLPGNALALSLWEGEWLKKKIHAHAQLKLIAATTNCRVRLYTCKILVIITPTTGSHSHRLPVLTQRPMLFLAASTPYMTMK